MFRDAEAACRLTILPEEENRPQPAKAKQPIFSAVPGRALQTGGTPSNTPSDGGSASKEGTAAEPAPAPSPITSEPYVFPSDNPETGDGEPFAAGMLMISAATLTLLDLFNRKRTDNGTFPKADTNP